MKFVKENFKSIAELTAIKERKSKRCMVEAFKHETEKVKTDYEWYGLKRPMTRGEVFDLMQGGWIPEGWNPERIRKTLITGEKTANKIYRDVVGCVPCVPAAIQGIPENMIALKRVKKPTKIVKILYDPSTPSAVSADDKFKAGLNLLSAIYALEKNGCRVDLNVSVWTTNGTEEIYCNTLQLKKPGSCLNLKSFAFCVAHPAYHRVVMFRWRDTVALSKMTGYGASLSAMEKAGRGAEFVNFRNDEIEKMGGAYLSFYTATKGVEAILEAIQMAEKK